MTTNSTTTLSSRQPQSSGNGGSDITGRKAAATLIFVVLAFVPLWTPFFFVIVYRTMAVDCTGGGCRCCDSSLPSRQRNVDEKVDVLDRIEAIFVWCGFVTFCINPFVYGWMNRAIRDELRSIFDEFRWSVVICWRRSRSAASGAGNGRSHWSGSSLDGGMPYGVGGIFSGDDGVGGLPDDAEDFFQFLERTSTISRLHAAMPPSPTVFGVEQRPAPVKMNSTSLQPASRSTTAVF